MASSPSPNNEGYAGFAQPGSAADQLNALRFLIDQAQGAVYTAHLVHVAGVNEDPKTVDLQILVNQVDGDGNATPHGIIYGVGYGQIRAGNSAVIITPVVGDLGIAVFAMRDISSVRATRTSGNPGSRRRYDPADALYVCGLAGGASPTQFVKFTADSIDVTSPTAINLTAPNITLDGLTHFTQDVTGEGKATFDGEVKSGSIGLTTHKHSGVTAGGANSGGPVP